MTDTDQKWQKVFRFELLSSFLSLLQRLTYSMWIFDSLLPPLRGNVPLLFLHFPFPFLYWFLVPSVRSSQLYFCPLKSTLLPWTSLSLLSNTVSIASPSIYLFLHLLQSGSILPFHFTETTLSKVTNDQVLIAKPSRHFLVTDLLKLFEDVSSV